MRIDCILMIWHSGILSNLRKVMQWRLQSVDFAWWSAIRISLHRVALCGVLGQTLIWLRYMWCSSNSALTLRCTVTLLPRRRSEFSRKVCVLFEKLHTCYLCSCGSVCIENPCFPQTDPIQYTCCTELLLLLSFCGHYIGHRALGGTPS